MALQNISGAGIWLPTQILGSAQSLATASDTGTLDADEEEYQVIGSVTIDGGGSKTFGTSGSVIGWLPGASVTFASGSTLRVGVKSAAVIDTAAGPPARATIGAAAFSVYKDLVGGTDTITSTTWLDTAMAAGTPFTVTDGDLIAICFHLETTSGTPSVKVRQMAGGTVLDRPAHTLVTSGPTYTAQSHVPNLIIKFDDGTIGWIEPSVPFSVLDVGTSAIGNTNINANVFQVPFSCKVDAIAAMVLAGATANFAMELYSDPLGTPAVIESVAVDANTLGVASASRWHTQRLVTPRTLLINTDYAFGVKQTTANAVGVVQRDISTAAYFKPSSLGALMYAAISTAGGAFAAQNSGNRRYVMAIRISALDDGASAGGGLLTHPGTSGRLI